MNINLLSKRDEVMRTINEFSDEQFYDLSVYVEFLQHRKLKFKSTRKPTASEILRQKVDHHSFESAREVDDFINAERDSWD